MYIVIKIGNTGNNNSSKCVVRNIFVCLFFFFCVKVLNTRERESEGIC